MPGMDKPIITARITSYNDRHGFISVWNRGGLAGKLVVNREDMYEVLNLLQGWVPIEDSRMLVLCPTGDFLRNIVADGPMLAIEDIVDNKPDECMVAELPNHVRLCYSKTIRDREKNYSESE